MALTILSVLFLAFLVLGVPVAFAIGLSSVITILYEGLPVAVVFGRMVSGMTVFSFLAIPFFIFAGELMLYGGIAQRIVDMAKSMVNHVRGGLGMTNVVACTLFGGVSGSPVADVSAMGAVMIPMMKKEGYDADYAVNVTTHAALVGALMPTSHNMIIYSLAAGGNLSIADLFTAGILPGLLLAVSLMVAAYLVARRKGYPAEAFPGLQAVLRALVVALPGLLLIAIIFGGVRSGVFTATESSCIAVVYALLVTVLVYRQLSWHAFLEATAGAVRTTAMVLLVIGMAASFGWLMAFLQVPTQVVTFMRSLTDNPIVMLLLINLILLMLGTFMDMAPMIIICTPILLPVVKSFGVDPIHFGVILILNAGIGLNTPPVGSVQFVACAIGKVSIGKAMRSVWPFYGASVLVLLVVTFVPQLSLWLPSLFRAN